MAAIIEVPDHHTPARGAYPVGRRGGAPVGVASEAPGPDRRFARVRPLSVLLVAALVLAGFLVVRFAGVALLAEPPSDTASAEHVVVGPGDTLWSIAGELDPSGPRSETLTRLVELNGGEVSVELGDVVAVPRSRR